MKTLLSAALFLALSACTYPDSNPATQLPSLAADQANPRLALMNHVLGDYFASDIPTRPTVCASATDGRNEEALPQEEERALMIRYPSLAPFSLCAYIDSAWQNAESGEPAMVFNLHNFTCASETRCTGFAGYQAGGTSSMSYRYTMEFENGAWSFTSDPRLLMDGQ